jgi:hypothetical protein
MKLFFVTNAVSDLSDSLSSVLLKTKEALLSGFDVTETQSPDLADAIIIQEKNSFKNFDYIRQLLNDPIISNYAHKVFTINDDESPTGILRGLYTSLPKNMFNQNNHVAVPYMNYPNEWMESAIGDAIKPCYLASWRGKIKSNAIRKKLVHYFDLKPGILLEQTDNLLMNDSAEKSSSVAIIKNAKFSLCPAGWSPGSYKIYESMALGRCPIIIADQFVRPIGPEWKNCALFFPERDLICLDSFLRIHESDHIRFGQNAQSAWMDFFSSEKIGHYYAKSLLSLINKATEIRLEKEIQRWSSFDLFWKNNWTIPQRIMTKAINFMVKEQA